MFGNAICNTDYYPNDSGRASLGNFRFPYELEEISKMRELVSKAADMLWKIEDRLDGWRKKNAFYLANMASFIVHCCTTTINTKLWYQLSTMLFSAENEQAIRNVIVQMRAVGEEEIQNAYDTIPLVEADSRLGWEPSMEYMTDRAHLEWKIKATRLTVNGLDMYTNSLEYNNFE